jgi:hypothetical protein
MRRKAIYLLLGLGALPTLFVGAFLHYYLPSTRKVQIVGTEVKRMDIGDNDGDARSRDVRFIITRDAITSETFMFRNEDTRWGWPPYFKFNSGDMAGDAANIKDTQPNATVLMTYYGWRVQVLDLYPNAVDLEIVDPRYTSIPWFNLFFFAFLFGGGGFFFVRMRRRWRRFRERRRARKEDKAASGDASEDNSSEAAS